MCGVLFRLAAGIVTLLLLPWLFCLDFDWLNGQPDTNNLSLNSVVFLRFVLSDAMIVHPILLLLAAAGRFMFLGLPATAATCPHCHCKP